MIETQLVFRNEYRWDLRKPTSVLFPYLFENTSSIIITVQPKNKLGRNYTLAGKLDQILIDYPKKLVGSSQVIELNKNYKIDFQQLGRYQLEFYPYRHLERTEISVSIILDIEKL